jgi:predicted metal-dependent hydrolase
MIWFRPAIPQCGKRQNSSAAEIAAALFPARENSCLKRNPLFSTRAGLGFETFRNWVLLCRVWLDFLKLSKPRRPAAADSVVVGSREVPLLMVRHPRARRYLLRLRADGIARVTIPRGGNQSEARQFVERSRGWLEEQLKRLAARPPERAEWRIGSEILFRGELVRIESLESGRIQFGGELLGVPDLSADLRPGIELHLRRMATLGLPPRVLELASVHGLNVQRISVRNQKSRWGSCSRRGTLSLNWRLIQTPPFVRDYIILHELAHLRHMNHSRKFWQEVERLCPDYPEAERWLKTNRGLLR